MTDEALREHAELTIKEIETRFKNRGWTTGKKLWEQRLLISAYKALGRTPPEIKSRWS